MARYPLPSPSDRASTAYPAPSKRGGAERLACPRMATAATAAIRQASLGVFLGVILSFYAAPRPASPWRRRLGAAPSSLPRSASYRDSDPRHGDGIAAVGVGTDGRGGSQR